MMGRDKGCDDGIRQYLFLQASKATGVMHIWQCYRVFEARNKGIQLSYCVGLEIGNNTYYLKAESASSYNEWIKVRSEKPPFSYVKERGSYICQIKLHLSKLSLW